MAARYLLLHNLQQQQQRLRRQPVYRDRLNPFENYDNEEFIKRYRFTKQTTQDIIELISDQLQSDTQRNKAIPPFLQVLTALQFYATGTFQQTVGDTINLSQPSVCRIVKQVSIAIASQSRDIIKYPDNLRQVATDLEQIDHFPRVRMV